LLDTVNHSFIRFIRFDHKSAAMKLYHIR
jgi:hypothetical protein